MKKTLFVAGFFVLSVGTCLAGEYQNYSCVDHENPGASCSYDPASVTRMAGKVKLDARVVYPSALPPSMITDVFELVISCEKATYQITTGRRTSPITVPATIVSRPVDRELLGSPFAGLYDVACKVSKNKKK